MRSAMRSTRPPVHGRARTVALAGICFALVACAAPIGPSTSRAPTVDPTARQSADLFAVVTADAVNFLVGIDVASQTVTRLTVLEQNEPQPANFGELASIPPVSVVLAGPSGSNPRLWTQASGSHTIVVRELDAAAGEARPLDGAPERGQLPFLYEGKLAWASSPGAGGIRSRIVSTDAGFDIELPGVAFAVVEGPGTGRITATVILPDNRDRVVAVDVATRKVTELPTHPVGLGHRGTVGGGTLWADEDTLVASAFSRKQPTPDDPDNGEPDKTVSLLTWSVDGSGSNPNAVAGLVAGPTLGTTEFYATNLVGADERVAVITGVFDEPWVEAVDLASGKPAWKLDLVAAEYVTGMTVSGTILVVLQNSHVTFIDLSSGDGTTVELGGLTMTGWVGP